jgi:hypothetical protein
MIFNSLILSTPNSARVNVCRWFTGVKKLHIPRKLMLTRRLNRKSHASVYPLHTFDIRELRLKNP